MKSVAVLISLLALATAGPVKHMYAPMHWLDMDLEERIVGGEETTIEDHPWQISIEIDSSFWNHYCGGSIINPTHIVTAAHCTTRPASSYQIRAGSTSRFSGGQVIRVIAKSVNPLYSSNTYDNDSAILKLASPLTLGRGVAAIKLASTRAPVGDKATVSGWGVTTPDVYPEPERLHAVTVPILSQESCKDSYGQLITDRMVCAGYLTGGYDACTGDSGGPLVGTNGELLGIVSFGRSCALAGYPGVYVSVPDLKEWFDENSDF